MARLEIDYITNEIKRLSILVEQTDELEKQHALINKFVEDSKNIKAAGVSLSNTELSPSYARAFNKILNTLSEDRFNPPKLKSPNFSDKELQKQLSSGVQKGLEGLFNGITDLGENFKEVFSNVFVKLANTVTNTFGQVLSTELGRLIGEKMGEGYFSIFGMGKTASKATVAGVGMLGSVLSAQGARMDNSGLAIAGGALSGAATGLATGLAFAGAGASIGSVVPVVGTIIGAAIGGIVGWLKSSEQKRQAELQAQTLAEQKKLVALQERANALAYTSSIVGRMSNQGIITGSDVNEFGEVTFRINGKDMVAVLDRQGIKR